MDLPQFYDEYVDKVYAFFYIKCLDRMTAEDLTSQTFTLFIEKMNEHEIADQKKYLYGIMRNVWIVFLQKKYKEAVDAVEDIEDFAVYAESSVDEYENAESVKDKLNLYIQKLPDKQKQVLQMRIIDDMSVADVAKALGKDKNYVKTTLHRAIKNMREALKHPYEKGAI